MKGYRGGKKSGRGRGGYMYGGSHNQGARQSEINFMLIGEKQVGVSIPYELGGRKIIRELKEFIKIGCKGVWVQNKKCWVIERNCYQHLLDKALSEKQQFNSQEKQIYIKVNALQSFVMRAQKFLSESFTTIPYNTKEYPDKKPITYSSYDRNIEPESLPFYGRLFPFQQQSLKFGIEKLGRILLADEMGVGKTVQSLALAYIYRSEWPMLIICPTSLKLIWKKEIEEWYPNCYHSKIQIMNTSKEVIRSGAMIYIVSYDLATKNHSWFDNVKVAIADEAHALKSFDSQRSKALVPFLATRKRVVLLTGTPAFAKPREIYNLIHIVRPDVFDKFKEFGNRYCDPKINHWSGKYEYEGCKNEKELYYLLNRKVMLRRLKDDVVKDLPQKYWQKVIVETEAKTVSEIQKILSTEKVEEMETFFSKMLGKEEGVNQRASSGENLMKAYKLTGLAKAQAVNKYLFKILQDNVKILVFAHHREVLDELETEVKKKYKYIRIDGEVTEAQRAENVDKFQKRSDVKVALLSITAAGVGLTLTKASTVVFAEMHWTPALMKQAEDRAHRISQKHEVNCHYLVGENTLDEMLFYQLNKKLFQVSSFVDGKPKNFEMELIPKGEIGKFSRNVPVSEQKPKSKRGFPLIERIDPPYQTHTQETDISVSSAGSQLQDDQIQAQVQPEKMQSTVGQRSKKRVPSVELNDFVWKKMNQNSLINQRNLQKQESEKVEGLRLIQEEKSQEKLEVQQQNISWQKNGLRDQTENSQLSNSQQCRSQKSQISCTQTASIPSVSKKHSKPAISKLSANDFEWMFGSIDSDQEMEI